MTREDALDDRIRQLDRERAQLEVVRQRLASFPQTFGELLDWLEHYRRWGNTAGAP